MFYYKNTNGLITLHCAPLDEYATHCFTTRMGGVSTGHCAQTNLSFSREDRETVLENYRRICAAEGFAMERLTLTDQTHTDRVRLVDETTAGMGVQKQSDIKDTDGLITDLLQAPLVVFVADCAPVLMADKRTGAVAAVHSGWKGTLKGIAAKAVQQMKENFGTDPRDIIAAVGPCIGPCCYEVGQDFKDAFHGKWEHLFTPKKDKYHFDLKQANRLVLQEAGVGEIYATNECTYCRSDLLFSHRKTQGKRGNMAGIIQRKETVK